MAAVTYTVKRGDSLWAICASSEWGPKISGNNIPAKINTLVSLNNIPNSNLIHPGQVLTLSGSGGSTGSSATQTPSSNCVKIEVLNLQADSSTGRDVFASWTWTKDKTKGFKIRWEWDKTVNGVSETQYQENETNTPGIRYVTFTIPEEVRKYNNWVQIFVTPISEFTKDANGNDTKYTYWTADEVGKQYFFKDNPPFVPDVPTCEIKDATLTIKIDEIKKEVDAASIIFQVIKDNKTAIYTSPALPVVSVTDDYGTVSHEYTVPLGSNYKARAKAVAGNGKQSGWTDFSNEVTTKPSAPTGVTATRRDSYTESDGTKKHSVFVEWTAVPNATEYIVEYSTNPNYFDAEGGNVSSVTSEKTSVTIVGIDSGETYYFRVRAVNTSEDESDPSTPLVQLTVGTPPAAPTTWSSVNSAFAGDSMELNWIHNATDGSLQSYAEVSLKIGDKDWESHVYVNTTNSDTGERIDTDNSWSYGQGISYKGNLYFKMDTTNAFLQNQKIQWKVRTAGVSDTFSDDTWSIERTIYVYEKPTMEMTMSKDALGETGLIMTLDSFPFYVVCDTDQNSDIQKPVGYHVRIVSNEYYVTVDEDGTSKTINSGDAVYENYISTNGSLSEEISANNVDLESGMSYTLYCTVDLSTGLTLTGSHEFNVRWTDVSYNTVADISFDKNTYTAAINPYCMKQKKETAIGKNLIDISAVEKLYLETIEINGDSIIFKDFGVSHFGCIWNNVPLIIGNTYTFSVHSVSVFDTSGWGWRLQYQDGTYSGVSSSSTWTVAIEKAVKSVLFYVSIGNLTTTQDVTLTQPMCELGTEATKYEPYHEYYVAGGKNLMPFPYHEKSITRNGVTFTVNDDGTVTANGTATGIAYIILWQFPKLPIGNYVLSGCPEGGSSKTYYMSGNGFTGVSDYGSGGRYSVLEDSAQTNFVAVVAAGMTVENLVFKPQLELGTEATEYEPYYHSYVDDGFVENVTLSVYRREYDGAYKKIASDIPNTNTSVTDPHPALDYARYRIVAKDTTTGAISYYDAPGYPVKCSSIIIQWDEAHSMFDTSDEYSVEGPPWSGSLLVLPYNVDVSDSRNRSASAVEYAGREHPVSYYGTHISESPSWSAVIPKEDKDTIYALRRLSVWAGDVYIREPSGMGYWANVRVSFNQKHKDVTIPVTLNITRVEGGV